MAHENYYAESDEEYIYDILNAFEVLSKKHDVSQNEIQISKDNSCLFVNKIYTSSVEGKFKYELLEIIPLT